MKVLCRKILLQLVLFGAMQGHAQNTLQQCGVRKSQAILNIVREQKGTDSLAVQKLGAIERDWQDCAAQSSMPAFRVSAINEEIVDSKALNGSIVMINFWFTSCAPCVAELPGLNKLVHEYAGKKIQFIGFTFEGRKKIVDEFFPEHPFDFTIVPESGNMEKIFGVDDYPSTFIIDGAGKVRKAWSGGSTGPEAKDEVYRKAKEVIDLILAEQGKAAINKN